MAPVGQKGLFFFLNKRSFSWHSTSSIHLQTFYYAFEFCQSHTIIVALLQFLPKYIVKNSSCHHNFQSLCELKNDFHFVLCLVKLSVDITLIMKCLHIIEKQENIYMLGVPVDPPIPSWMPQLPQALWPSGGNYRPEESPSQDLNSCLPSMSCPCPTCFTPQYPAAAAAKLHQSCPTLCDPIDGSPPGSSIPWILQARTLELLPFPSPMHESEKWKWSRTVVSNSSRPHGLQPTRLLHPWDFPGKSTGVGCHCLLLAEPYTLTCLDFGEFTSTVWKPPRTCL